MRKAVTTDRAPKAIGPYSQAVSVSAGRMVFCSGQIPLDPETGNMVDGDIALQTERVMKNLEAVLGADGMTFGNVVRTTIFLADMNDFAKVNEVYGRYFKEAPPARATVQAAALPKGARVEIDCIAVG
ncbi:MAG: RidA family protein [Deltaproteobacteria bacterium]|nr:RidA family protein [Deltaproteobacteria bacterium]